MKRRVRSAFSAIIIVWLCLCVQARTDAMLSEEVLSRIKTYRFGQSRSAPAAIEGMVAAARANPAESQRLAEELAAVLATDATYDCKQFVCRQLALIGTEKQARALAGLLTDERLSHMALYAMVPTPGAAVDEALRAALDQTAGRTKIGIVNALGNRRDRKALVRLGELSASGDGAIAGAAAWAVAKIGGSEAAELLENAVSKARGTSRTAVADAYLACADGLLEAGDRESAQKMYGRMYAPGEASTIRAAALKGLAMSKGEQAAGYVVEGLSENDRQIRRMASRLAREIPGEAATRLFAGELPKLPAGGQATLLNVLADRGDRAALPAVLQACKSPEESVRVEALKALGGLGDASAVTLLAERAADGDRREREAARESLGALKGDDVNSRIIAELGKARAPVRAELIKSLGQRGVSEAADTLMRTAGDEDAAVRVASLRVLRDLAGCEHVPALVEMLAKAGPRERSEAEKTVVAAARRCPDEAARTSGVLAKLDEAKDAQTKVSLLNVLGRIGGDKALAVLVGAVRDAEPEIGITAVRILAEWPTDEPLDELLDVVRTTRDARQRAVALRGYVRLVGLAECRNAQEAFEIYRKAMGFAANAAEKKLVLSGLANVESASALEFAGGYLDDAGMRAEAEAAILKIAGATCGAYRERTGQILGRVVRETSSDAVRNQGSALIERINRLGEYVTAWQVSPAYTRDGAGCTELFDIAFAPERGAAEQVCWRLMPAGTNPEQPWLLDLLALHGGDNRVAYLRNRVWSSETRTVVLELGSDDGVKVWLNGKIVHSNNTMRAIQPAQEKVTLTLQEGWNTLMLKITQNVMGWGVCARFAGAGGRSIEGLRFQTQ